MGGPDPSHHLCGATSSHHLLCRYVFLSFLKNSFCFFNSKLSLIFGDILFPFVLGMQIVEQMLITNSKIGKMLSILDIVN